MNIFNKLSENHRVIVLFFIITTIFLFPAFLGKVDTPIDIRDSRMYPWSYYAVDKQIKGHTLWDSNFSYKEPVYLTVLPNSANEKIFKFNIDDLLVRELSNVRNPDIVYYFAFDFKTSNKDKHDLSFEISLFDSQTKLDFKLPVEIIEPASKNSKEVNNWYKSYVSLKELIKMSILPEDLGSYSLKIKIQNRGNTLDIVHIKDLKLFLDDYSRILKAHNPFVEDLIQWFTPTRDIYAESLKKGKIPYWNNYTFTGIELINGDPQIGYFHPLYILLYFLFDHFTAHLVLVFLCFVLCGFGTYLLTRYWGFNIPPAMLTSIVYMFHPYNVYWFSFEHMVMNSAVLPFLLLCYEKNLKKERFLNKYLIFCALLLGLIFISGHLQIGYYTVIFFFLFTIFCFLRKRQNNNFKKHFSRTSFVFSFALMIGAVVIIPFLPFLQNSHRVAFSESAMRELSTPLRSLWTLLNPQKIDELTLSYFYFGILPLLFSIFSLSMAFKKKLTLFFLVLIVSSLLICTGSPLFFMIKDFVPGFNQLQHHRFMEIYSYSVPFLAGIGCQIIYSYLSQIKNKLAMSFAFLVILISAFDLIYNSSAYYMSWSDRKDYNPIHKGGALEFIINEQKKSKEPFRILPFTAKDIQNVKLKTNVAIPNTLVTYRIEDVSGYSSLIPNDIYQLFIYIQTHDVNKLYSKVLDNCFKSFNLPYPITNYKSKILDLLNVKYFLVPNFFVLDGKNTKRVYSGDCAVYENEDYLPRAFVVPNFKVIESPKETILELGREGFNPREEVILMALPMSLRGGALTLTRQSPDIQFLKYEQNNIALEVDVNKTTFLVLGNNLNDNWEVKVNGKKEKHFQANLVQRAVYLPSAGNYLIEFYYSPKIFFIGLLVTLCSALSLVLMLIYLRFKKCI